MIELPTGTFRMGSPPDERGRYDDETQHEVVLTRRFAMSVTPVTQAQYQAVMGLNPSSAEDVRAYGVGPDHPVFGITFRQALEYANHLSQLEGLSPCYALDQALDRWADLGSKGYRLPTEAEWEYAARAGEGWRYAGSDDPAEVAWFADNSDGRTHPVGAKKANAWGLYDMSGNVWEWVWDWYAPYSPRAQRDPTGPEAGSDRVLRGGSFGVAAGSLRVADRFGGGPSGRSWGLGFRLSRSL